MPIIWWNTYKEDKKSGFSICKPVINIIRNNGKYFRVDQILKDWSGKGCVYVTRIYLKKKNQNNVLYS